MIAPILFLLAAQAKPAVAAPPMFPPMSSQVFQDTMLGLEQALQKGDFAAAKKLGALLPHPVIRLVYNESKLPIERRPSFRIALSSAVRAWTGVNVTVVDSGGDIKLSFGPQLAPDPQTNAPANVALFFNNTPDQPRLEAVSGLKRGNPLRDLTPESFASDVKFAIGSYLGLASIDIPNRVMNGSQDVEGDRGISPRDQEAVRVLLTLSNKLRAAVAAKKVIGISRPASAFIDPPAFEGPAIQGDQVDLPVQVSNRGQGPLVVLSEGDCGCVFAAPLEPVPAGESALLKARVDTRELTGPVERQVYVYTNDPNMPSKAIPVKLAISPRYRFLMPGGNAVTVDPSGAKFDVFFTYPDGDENKMVVTQARTIGLEGATATVVPWTGSLADPDLKEPERVRHGYRISVSVPGTLPPGRSPITLALFTNDFVFKDIYYTINLQQGIVALPEELFLGELPHKAKTSTVILSRPRRPFEVKSVKTNLKNFTVKAVPDGREDEVKLEVTYDGKAPSGAIEGAIIVETTDPKQPTIKVPIVGSSS